MGGVWSSVSFRVVPWLIPGGRWGGVTDIQLAGYDIGDQPRTILVQQFDLAFGTSDRDVDLGGDAVKILNYRNLLGDGWSAMESYERTFTDMAWDS